MRGDKQRYLEFVDQWNERPENRGRSFTYGGAMYDGIRESRFDFDGLGIGYDVRESIKYASGANDDWVESLSDEAIAEILDISELDEYGRQIQDEQDEEDKEDVMSQFDYDEEYDTREEFQKAIQDACEGTYLDRRDLEEEIEDEYSIVIKEEQEPDEDEEICDECGEVHSEDNDALSTKEVKDE